MSVVDQVRTDDQPHTLLRFATAGSVDDGKSTLVGRLLYDTKSILADQLAAVEQASVDRGLTATDLALLTDGLRAEREQGITIDVAYRYFSTANRSYVLADTPGHVQYTRNMVTGASTAELALILVDARHGIVEQTRRHLAVTGLLGVRHVALAVNKMDLVDFDEAVFVSIRDDFALLAKEFGIDEVTAIPLSALAGDNVVDRSDRTPWFDGPTLLEHLETVDVAPPVEQQPFRFAVQYVIRPRSAEFPDYRGYAGRISAGSVKVGDRVVVTPGGRQSTVVGIDRGGRDGALEELTVAHAQQSVTLRLADDLDISRGAVIADVGDRPVTVTELTGTAVVVAERPVRPRDRVLLRVGARQVRGMVSEIVDQVDITTLQRGPAPQSLELNALGRIGVRLAEPVSVDEYSRFRTTGSFLLISESDGTTLAAGMIESPLHSVADEPESWSI
ncbi:sulfate adenylyltransferase subunit 1 [Naumannella halotolerans]|uniref:sulfate adenylyltransferase subunit 1 n=1 Tax=Naumannella halotolerans TaxID=993414 RepID=UPI00370D0DE5